MLINIMSTIFKKMIHMKCMEGKESQSRLQRNKQEMKRHIVSKAEHI